MKADWDTIGDYLSREALHAPGCILYGPWAPPEAELQLLGDVRGREILEIGCGAGQCSIALARQGARVTGLDLSARQLDAAHEHAAAAGIDVNWVHGSASDLAPFAGATFDLLIASYVLPYIDDLPRAFGECARVLKPGGRWVFALDHPLRTAFYDEVDGELVAYPWRSYFDTRPYQWTYHGPEIRLTSQHRTIAQWIELGRAAGLQLQRLLEPEPPRDLLDDLWPEDDPRAPLRHLPQAIIFVMSKPG